ncbi:hypothetical protein E1265_26060 [Streptomyces sp. 8K308]|uniref:hypothetical protein n=1 Tax=Streptomyces sp. 8K308 TaxID=2530388 RepID=UPI001047C2DF|nr:hypothetical protein [Streptomyces sp. 8K308]TDC15879.1 hypothetical protein E1265_26060 [Streptomyces sp. 8K308]
MEGPWHEDFNSALLRETMAEHPNDWWVVADLDEFHVYDRPLPDFLAYCEREGYDFVEGAFLDRVAENGELPEVGGLGAVPLWRRYPLAGMLTLPLLGARPTKVTLARGFVELDLGQHRAWTGSGAPVHEIYAQVHHFKWTASVERRLTRESPPMPRASGSLSTRRSSPSRGRSSITYADTVAA